MTVEGLSPVQQKKAIATRRLLIEGIAIIVFGIILMGVIPSLLPAFQLKLLGRFLSLAIVALGVDLIWGYTGLLSLGQGIFFALGGYGLAMHLSLQLPEGQIPSLFRLYGV
ncbi:MAG: urea ABC transporter permease subunit UrtC, partial [Spirulina sp. DLM2.Bin59]